MALVAFVTSSATAGVLATLTTGDDLLIAPGVAVARTDAGTAITGTGSANICDIYGLLAADSVCIFLGDDGAIDTGHRMTVHEDGIVRSYAAGGASIALRGFNSSVTNLGTITALGEGVIVGGISTTTQSVVENSGTIIGDNNAVVRFSNTTETVVVLNSGLISSADDAFFSSSNSGIDLITNTGRMVGDVELSGGNDVYNGAAGRLTGKVFAGDGIDTVTGGIDNDWFEGGEGDDTLDGNGGVDQLFGGLGNDVYFVDQGVGEAVELEGQGIDSVFALFGHTLAANVENLTLLGTGDINGTGNTLANTLIGNSLNNILDGAAGVDLLQGGLGNDTYVVDNAADQVVESAGAGTDHIASFVTGVLALNVENLTLAGTAAIDGTGNADANAMTGNTGDNKLFGLAGNDALNGGIGNDILNGGIGNDTYIVDSAADQVVESAGAGTDRIASFVTEVLALNVENLTLAGKAAIDGTGNTADNAMIGNTGNNKLFGVAGNDALNGGIGNDTLIGGLGKDTMTGDAGADDFDFNSVAEIGKGATRDVIRDFTHLSDDIDLSTIDANGAARGNAAFSFLAAKGAAFTGVAGQLRWFQDNRPGTVNDKTIVEGDNNGNRIADFQIQLTGLKTLTGADFVL